MQDSFTQCAEYSLRTKFEEIVIAESNAAAKAGEGLMIMMFGHEVKGSGLFWFKESDVNKKPHFRVQDFVKFKLKQLNIPITLLTTACYGGSCISSTRLDVTEASAAGSKKPSYAWRSSGSSGRATGSVFVTALANKLTVGMSPNNQDQYTTMLDFQVTLSQLLSDTDKRWYKMEPQFKVQEDEWEDNWATRTGFPVEGLQTRWNTLRGYSRDNTLHVGDFLNRDPDVPDEVRAEFARFFEEFKKSPESSHTFKQKYWEPRGSKRSTNMMIQGDSIPILASK